jgi:flagellar biosynthesis protein
LSPSGQGKLQDILRACALEFRGDDAPIVRWYAEGDAAARLIELARKEGVRIEEDQAQELLLALRGVKLNSRIPREIYMAVARIYAYMLREKTEKPN